MCNDRILRFSKILNFIVFLVTQTEITHNMASKKLTGVMFLRRTSLKFQPKVFTGYNGKQFLTTHTADNITQVSNSSKSKLSFDEYRKLKNSLKMKGRIAGVPFAFTGMLASSMIATSLLPNMFDATPENVQLIMGMDPLVFCGICGVAASGVGFVVGKKIYEIAWNTIDKEQAQKFHATDMDFLQRLEKHRFKGESKFGDDYYGESIKTLSDYRQWIRTQQSKKN